MVLLLVANGATGGDVAVMSAGSLAVIDICHGVGPTNRNQIDCAYRLQVDFVGLGVGRRPTEC